MRLSAHVVLCAAFLAFPAVAEPALMGEAARPECKDALKMAQRAYDSKSFYLYEARDLAKGLESQMVMGPIDNIDLSGGDAVVANEGLFIRVLSKGQDWSRTHWQVEPQNEVRLVLEEDSVGWRGNMHTLYAIPAKLDFGGFRWTQKNLTPVIMDSWQVPLVFKRAGKGGFWALDTGSSDWRVYVISKGQMGLACTIRFESTLDVVPPEVRVLADLLNEALGPGLDEGTLQPTAHLRHAARQTWANVVMRPWAMPKPYNTRPQVEAGLKNWASNGRTYKALHARIYQQYPLAQQALVQLYEARFGKSPQEAEALAAQNLDIAFRSYFVFPRERLVAPDRSN